MDSGSYSSLPLNWATLRWDKGFDPHNSGGGQDALSTVNFGGKKKRSRSVLERPVVAKTVSAASSERTEELPSSPKPAPAGRRSKGKRAIVLNDNEEDALVGQEQEQPIAKRRPFPEGAEYMAEELSNFLHDGVARFHTLAKMVRQLENDKVVLVNKVVAAEAKAREAEKEKAAAISTAEATKAELTALKAEVVASQGQVLRAFTERLFFSGRFSGLANELADIVNAGAVSATIDEIAEDYPDLDKSKYGYEETSAEAILRAYAKSVSESLKTFPVLENLAATSSLLTAESVRACSVDRDDVMEKAIAELGNHLGEPRSEAEESQPPTGAEAEAEEPH